MAAFKIFVVLFALSHRSFCASADARSELARLNYFDIDLLRYCAEERHGNVLVSPASIKCTLAMLLEGSRGATEAELRSALRLPPNRDDFREQLNSYLESLSANSSNVVLKNANSIFASKKLKMRKEFEMHIKNTYLTEVFHLDFVDAAKDAALINKWVAAKTMGLIPDIVEPVSLTPATEILMANAIYFKATWQNAFDPAMTRSGCFYFQGVCKNVAMMDLRAQLNYAYVEELRAHALELPYEGGRYSMVVLVPLDRDGCPLLIRDLPYMSLGQVSQLLEPSDVQLSMPKFTINYEEDMVGPLRSMRVHSLFSSTSSNLTGIFEDASPLINSLYHKVHMAVDEQGTVAAASSAAMVIPLIENGVTLRVDRPFVFFIKDNKLGVVLFEGRIEEPTPFVDHVDVKGRFSEPRHQWNEPPKSSPFATKVHMWYRSVVKYFS